MLETTALGSAYLAGLASGFWSSVDEIEQVTDTDSVFEPEMEQEKIDELYEGWQSAVSATQSFKPKHVKEEE